MKSKFIEKTFVPAISLSPNAAHYYSTALDGFTQSKRHKQNQVNLSENEHSGVVSAKGRKRLENALQWMIYYAKDKWVTDSETGKRFKFKINFITLTLSSKQSHSDKEVANVCLGYFLDVCRKQFNVSNYVWRAEAQDNGNIHFHIVTDVYIFHKEIRRIWNQAQERLGYISSYEKKWKNRNPNSIDVHSVKHVDRLSSYLSKYMAKERAFACIGELRLVKGEAVEVLYCSTQYRSESAGRKQGKVVGHILGARLRTVTSKLWSCNRELSNCRSLIISADMPVFNAIDEKIFFSNARCYKGEFVHSYYGDFKEVVDFTLSVLN